MTGERNGDHRKKRVIPWAEFSRIEKGRAHAAVRRAVLRGDLPAAATLRCCDCGGRAADYDHYKGYAPENYLEIQAVCRACHSARTFVAYGVVSWNAARATQ